MRQRRAGLETHSSKQQEVAVKVQATRAEGGNPVGEALWFQAESFCDVSWGASPDQHEAKIA